jgi:hypothetical protein
MLGKTLIAALALAAPVCFAQTTTSPLSPPATPAPSTTSPQVPSTGSILRPGDTRLPGSDTTPGLSTLPGVNDLERQRERERDNASFGATRPPFGMGGTAPRPSSPGCVPGSISNPC